MKTKLIALSMVGALLLCAWACWQLDDDNGTTRIWQHETARQPEAGCDCDGASLCSHLPLVIIDTEGRRSLASKPAKRTVLATAPTPPLPTVRM